MNAKSSTYPLRLPKSLKAAVEKASSNDGTSINQFVVTAIAEKLSAMQTAEFFMDKRAHADVERAMQILNREGTAEPIEEDHLG